jgi:hypothetical protein
MLAPGTIRVLQRSISLRLGSVELGVLDIRHASTFCGQDLVLPAVFDC